MTHPLVLRSLVTLAVAGCATSYLYEPSAPSTWLDGYPATTTQVPPEAPQGTVTATSFGILEITANGQPLEVVHARLVVINDGDATPWSIATADQQLELPGRAIERPMYVNTDAPANAVIQVGQRERRVVDLYYGLPAGVHDERDLAGFQLLWKVTTPAREIASRTAFARVVREPPEAPPVVVLHAGWGPYWWFDPFWGRPGFYFHRPIVVVRPGGVIISRPPHRHPGHPPGHPPTHHG
ncbi:MAG TPA: hypothetical protein VFP84_05620 [Kofleriaceae bacterium]|nr:hypothetical protein [Kofleriaceae bacterium]